ncbi:NAD-dependent succinate-semialdehyde dehydrogenase [Arsenicitalea aurantiaca]|uniref:NAD-dependent succinate-semialdehyde dehydrogenase n=1 Tax=Arsenicitalea aurantiaca TaxID=1783274 RepID=A0A433XKS6_9HYPH|nr:NAD-dependent succinate-semialdehyde dehydrogenase [Arsenicitalea aurantiaca]RUT34685.1 NAD-dependent succinate-semialdehyde dehydrogenase [Arsenicitalea aurantiaca]
MTKTHDAALLINGAWIGPDERASEPIENPATGQPIGRVPHARRDDIEDALAAADRAFPGWKNTPPIERSRIMRRAADLIRERSEEIAAALVLEQGKRIAEARIEIAGAAEHIDWMAEEGRRTYGRIVPGRVQGVRQSVLVEPIGVVAAFAPWNFPATTPAKKFATALAAGCCCILKGAEETPLTAVAFARAFTDAGVPKGVIGLLFGNPPEISETLISSEIVRKVSFTGSPRVGRQLAALAASFGKPATMELGGHAPVLVYADADLDDAVAQAVAAKFRNAGQVCVSPTRFIVQEQVYEAYLERFVARASALRLGPGDKGGSEMGPLANRRRLGAVQAIVEDARKAGATVRTGGETFGNEGYYYRPTVLTDIPETARVLHDEPFGPIAAFMPFSDHRDGLAKANATVYGLAAYAFTQNASRQIALSEGLQAGLIGINTFAINGPETPWGGVRDSGYGRESAIEGLQSCLVSKFAVQKIDAGAL